MLLKRMIFLALAGCAGAVAGEAGARAPTAPWVVDFHPAQCVAYREYGTGEDPLRLVLKSPPVGEVMQLSVMRRGSKETAAQVEATILIDEAPPIRSNLLMVGTKDDKLRIYQLNMALAEFDRVKGAKKLTIRSEGLSETFALSQMGPLLKVMQECVADLRAVWNVSDATGESSQLARRASANIPSFFSDDDYPEVAIRQSQTGSVRFALLIDESGGVADCTVIGTSGIASLDARTCAVLQTRGKFQPAADRAGKPAKDAVISRVLWQMRPVGKPGRWRY
jgi:TonB family protein